MSVEREAELHVVAAVIRDPAGRILISRRPEHAHLGGFWEFPGGKVEADETARLALVRELAEELGLRPGAMSPLIGVRHAYPDRRIYLEVWTVGEYEGEPRGREGQRIAWVAAADLADYPLPPADLPVLKAIGLPARYLITPDPGPDHGLFLRRLETALRSGHTLVQFRASALSEKDYVALGRRAARLCESYGARLLINGDPQRLSRIGAHGVHLSGSWLHRCGPRATPGAGLLGASCHSPGDLDRAHRIGVDFAVLSPVLPTRSHPEARPLGWARFRAWVAEARIPVYALGGLSEAELERARSAGAQGVAGIRAFWPKGVAWAQTPGLEGLG